MGRERLTAASGAPIAHEDLSRRAGANGPLATESWRLYEKLPHLNRERIPEHVIHTRGTGAHGTFTLMERTSRITRSLREGLQKRQSTPLAARHLHRFPTEAETRVVVKGLRGEESPAELSWNNL